MEYKLIRSQRKTLALKITKNAELVILAPKKCSLQYINNFIQQKQNWIAKNICSIQEKNLKLQDFFKYDKMYIFGTEHKILDNINHYQIGQYYIKQTKASNKIRVIKQFLIKLANEYIMQRTDFLAQKLNLEYKDIQVISARKKWGSCNNFKQLKFNFRLVMLPPQLIDYVICHELCHTKYLNHGKEFWLLLEKLGYKKTAIKQAFSNYNFVLELF